MNSTKKDGTGMSQEKNLSLLGPTGKFPQGKLNQQDEGELQIAIGIRGKAVIIEFGKEIAWIGFEKEDGIAFVNALLEKLEKL